MVYNTPRRSVNLAAYWNDSGIRPIVLQCIALLAVVAVGIYLFHNTQVNLQQRGIASGFGFLSSPSGFGIAQTLIPYSETSTYGRVFWVGLLNTLLVAGLGIILATLIGFIIGIARLSRNWLIARLATVYIEVFRNIPLLLQIFFWYFAVLRTMPAPRQSLRLGRAMYLNIRGLYLPKPLFESGFGWVLAAFLVAVIVSVILMRWARRRQEATGQRFPTLYVSLGLIISLPVLSCFLAGFPLNWEYPALQGLNFSGGLSVMPELVALLAALSVYTAAFIAEIVRAGIQSVSQGQTEAAYSLGLRPAQTLRLVIIPQSLWVIIPLLTSQYLNLTKNSSLAAAIAYPDLVSVFAGTVLNQTGQAIEVIAITMAVYLTISLLISLLMNGYNRRIARVER